MTQSKDVKVLPSLSGRRKLFTRLGMLVAACAVVKTASVASDRCAKEILNSNEPLDASGYRLTEHVQKYYRSARL